MDMRKLVGRNAARLRKAADLTQEQLAELAGMSQQYISDLERGKCDRPNVPFPIILSLPKDEQATALEGRWSW